MQNSYTVSHGCGLANTSEKVIKDFKIEPITATWVGPDIWSFRTTARCSPRIYKTNRTRASAELAVL